MNKAEILEKLKTLVQNEDIEAINTEVNDLADHFLSLHKEELEKATPKEEDTASTDENEAKPLAPEPQVEKEDAAVQPEINDPLYDEFDALFKDFKTKKAAYFRAKAEEESHNLKAKKELIDKLKKLVSQEENIGKAFAEMKSIQEQWNEVGQVARNQRQEIQQEYSNAVEEFYYNINIYKELKEHDFHRNLQLKESVIEELKALLKIEKIKDIEAQLRTLQNKWEKIGITRQEDWERLKNQYWDVVKALYQKISDHYEGRKREREENLKKKEELIEQTKEIVADIDAIDEHKKWSKLTDQILGVQKQWKSIGYAPKPDNDRVWKEFRALCDQFFETKSAFYAERNDAFKEIKDRKQKLIDEVKSIKNSKEWKATAARIKSIQKQWQKVGNAGPKFEQKLWKSFREECDYFFNKRDEHFAKMNVELDENLKQKEELLKAIEAFKPDPKKQEESVQKLNEFAQKFAAIGQVPRKDFKNINSTYKKLMDAHYDALDLSENKVEEMRFEARLDGIKDSGDAQQKFDAERQKIRKRINKLKEEIVQYETNLSFFTTKSSGKNPLLEAAEQNLKQAQDEVEMLKERLKKIPKV